MRVLTEFLHKHLLDALAEPEEDILNGNAQVRLIEPSIVIVSRSNSQKNAVVVNDKKHSIWGFLPKDFIAKARKEYPHIQSVKDLCGCVLRIKSCHFSTPFRESMACQIGSNEIPICLVLTSVEIHDASGAQANEAGHILSDPYISHRIRNKSIGFIESAILPKTSNYYRAYYFNDNKPLTHEDCIIPSNQEHQLFNDLPDITDSQLIAENGSVPDFYSLPNTESIQTDLIHPVPTQENESVDEQYAFCHQRLSENFIQEEIGSTSTLSIASDHDKENQQTQINHPSTELVLQPPVMSINSNQIMTSRRSSSSSSRSLNRRPKDSRKRRNPSSRFEWMDDSNQSETQELPLMFTQPLESQPFGASRPLDRRPNRSTSNNSSSTLSDVVMDNTQWQTQAHRTTSMKETVPSTLSSKSVDHMNSEAKLLEIVQDTRQEEDEPIDFFQAMHFRPNIRNGSLYSIQQKSYDCTAQVRVLLAALLHNPNKRAKIPARAIDI